MFGLCMVNGSAHKDREYNAAKSRGLLMNTAGDLSWTECAFLKSSRASLPIIKKEAVDSTHLSWVVCQQNLVKVHCVDVISKEQKGKRITLAVLVKLSSGHVSFNAPKMSCASAVVYNNVVHVVNVTPGECFQDIGKVWSNTRVLGFEFGVID